MLKKDKLIPNPELFQKNNHEIPFHQIKNANHNKSILANPNEYQKIIEDFLTSSNFYLK